VGAPGSRAMMRQYCSQVWRQAQLWNRIEKAVRVSEFTFPGDPMRLDYGYRRNGTRGFVHTLSVSRAPADCKLLAYTAERIAKRFPSEFTAVTDIELQPEQNERHLFVRDTLRDAGITSLDIGAFASWVPKLKAQMQSQVTSHYTSGSDQFSSVSFTLCRNWWATAPSTTRWS
jgi:hypothetical protein